MNLVFIQRVTSAILLILWCSISQAFSQSLQLHQQQAIVLHRMLEKKHYSPRTVDDKLSGEIFTQFIKLIDEDGFYFTDPQIKALSVHKFSIDEELQGKSWKFLPQVIQLYQQRLQEVDKLIAGQLQKPLSFSANQTITFSQGDSLHFAANDQELSQKWNKWLKYQILRQLVLEQDKNNSYLNFTETYFQAKEPAVRQKLLAVEKRKIKRILEHPAGYENYLASLFCDAIAACYDPHTTFFSKTEWENFQSQLSTESLSFGLDLEESEGGDIVISRLVPGGPAWKSNELHKDDIVTAVKWAGKPEVDLAGADIDEAEDILQSSNSGRLEITVKKTNGLTKTVGLIKEKIREEENIVKSYILKGDRKIGYITLPGFYTEWENGSGQGCANDVAKEIVKLKAANIEGLILDIRYNGGGSLAEGLNLAGIFIEEGPLCVLQERGQKPVVMKDINRGTVYDGPLVVMINGQSASASEILASTLQDYNRALIVGSPTFGKSTGQIILPLDTLMHSSTGRLSTVKEEHGFAKVTIEKIYRVTGKSAQIKGVTPDVHIPDVYQALAYRESSLPFVLSGDSIQKKIYYTPLKPLPIKELAGRSVARVSTHPSFTHIQKFIEREKLKTRQISRTIPLQPQAFVQTMQEKYDWWQSLEKALIQSTTLFSVENTHYDKQVLSVDAYSQEVNSLSQKNIQEDIYIEETYRIVSDLISMSTTK
ncbi:carboxy terminal-processing peptidase [Rhodocytophaga aerolata]|uniref:Carboxy terminal-processing peptidase n=1 Tax=Rhodocytophaga aerolata TaxID=455078 RepID=A0ABT8R989_9BACT|nr:carboxy terminal-processing peptidase [Rhodocytophaga aerolata]MDO1448271.1 carboxy terminal-processing peptidase [Rhodocytophaga aerolata]